MRGCVLCKGLTGWALSLWLGLWAVCGQAASLSDVVVEIPDDLRPLVEKAIGPVVESARLDDLGDVQQLYRRIRPVVQDVLGAQGYFTVEVRRNRDLDEEETVAPKLRFKVDPGKRSRIASVKVEFDGHLADSDSEESKARRTSLRGLWQLKEGEYFSQQRWESSKDAILGRLLARDYPAAVIANSLADVDPEANEVHLTVEYDTGPQFFFGDLEVTGLQKYPPDLIARYSTLRKGDPFEQERLLQLLADLQNTPYFSSVDVRVDPVFDQAQAVPIKVDVVEGDSRRVGFGAGYSSNTGFRTEVTYYDNNLFGRAYSLVTGARLEQKRQSLFSDVFLPPSEKGVQDSVGLALDYQDIDGLDIERTSAGVRREYQTSMADLALGVNFQLEERLVNDLSIGQAKALVASAAATRNRVDDRLNPSRGYVAFAQVAVASEALASDQDFVRLAGKYQQFWSLDAKNLFSARFELGAVFADSRREIPQSYLFRAGGSNSVRGYDFLDLGVVDQGVLQGGRRLSIASLEYTHWLKDPFGVSVFTDIGDVADSWGELSPKPSIGTGVRYRTPAGPIALDVAKARGEAGIKIHFALGVTF